MNILTLGTYVVCAKSADPNQTAHEGAVCLHEKSDQHLNCLLFQTPLLKLNCAICRTVMVTILDIPGLEVTLLCAQHS